MPFAAELQRLTARCLVRGVAAVKWLELAHQLQGRHAAEAASAPHPVAQLLVRQLSNALSPPWDVLEYLRAAVLGHANSASSSSLRNSSTSALCPPADLLIAVSAEALADSAALSPASLQATLEILFSPTSPPLDAARILEGARLHLAQSPGGPVTRLMEGCAVIARALFEVTALGAAHLAEALLRFLELSLPSLLASTSANGAPSSDMPSFFRLKSVEGISAECRRVVETIHALVTSAAPDISRPRGLKRSAEQSLEASTDVFTKAIRNVEARTTTWGNEMDVDALLAAPGGVETEPEVVVLLSFLVDRPSTWQQKVEAAVLLLNARLSSSSHPKDKTRSAFYLSLLHHASLALLRVLEQTEGADGVERRCAVTLYAKMLQSCLCGMIPALIRSLEDMRGNAAADRHSCVQQAMRALLLIDDAPLRRCESLGQRLEELELKDKRRSAAGAEVVTRTEDENMLDEFFGSDSPKARPLRLSLLRSLIELDLVPSTAAQGTSLEAEQAESARDGLSATPLIKEAGSVEALPAFLGEQLAQEGSESAVERLSSDFGAQRDLSLALLQFMREASASGDLEALARVCKALQSDPALMVVSSMFVGNVSMLRACGAVFDRSDLGQNGEEPSVLGAILLFIQSLVQRSGLEASELARILEPDMAALPAMLRSYSLVRPLGDLTSEERDLVDRWIHALFDSDGIPDELIRASSPQAILRLAPLLFSQSLSAHEAGIIDLDTLKGGLAYFLQDLLSYALPSALHWLLREVQVTPLARYPASSTFSGSNTRSVFLELLSSLIMQGGYPPSILELVAPKLTALLRDPALQAATVGSDMDLAQMNARIQGAWEALPPSPASSRQWIRPLLNSVGDAASPSPPPFLVSILGPSAESLLRKTPRTVAKGVALLVGQKEAMLRAVAYQLVLNDLSQDEPIIARIAAESKPAELLSQGLAVGGLGPLPTQNMDAAEATPVQLTHVAPLLQTLLLALELIEFATESEHGPRLAEEAAKTAKVLALKLRFASEEQAKAATLVDGRDGRQRVAEAVVLVGGAVKGLSNGASPVESIFPALKRARGEENGAGVHQVSGEAVTQGTGAE